MAKRKNSMPSWFLPALLVTGALALFAKSAGAKTVVPKGNVQTTTVGNRVYSVNRLGQGTYLVTLISTGGVIETLPVNFTFDQAGPMAEFGDSAKVAQLKADLANMSVDFRA